MADTYPRHDVFQAIADPTRREMLKILSENEMSITSISGYFPISRTAVTKHLHVLEDAGLVSEKRIGRETRYLLQPEPLQELKRWLSYYERFWDNKLAALKNFVEDKDT
jgi:DNA-binding transcriptional ArsR family regulator